MFIRAVSSIFLLLSSPVFANDITITQSGAGLDLDVTQDGQDNNVTLSMDGTNTTFEIKQIGDNHKMSWVSYWGSGAGWGGDIDGNNNSFDITQYNNQSNTSAGGTIGFHIQGNDNALMLAQGCAFSSASSTTCSSGSYEAANHVMNVDVHGNDNSLKLGQRSSNSDKHDMTVYVYGDNNSVFGKQKGSGEKDLYLRLNGNGHSRFKWLWRNGYTKLGLHYGKNINTLECCTSYSFCNNLSCMEQSNSSTGCKTKSFRLSITKRRSCC